MAQQWLIKPAMDPEGITEIPNSLIYIWESLDHLHQRQTLPGQTTVIIVS